MGPGFEVPLLQATRVALKGERVGVSTRTRVPWSSSRFIDAKPPGLFYLVNLHPYARLSASMNLLDDHVTRVGVLIPTLSPLSATRVACSNGTSKPGPITDATLEEPLRVAATLPAVSPPEAKPTLPEHREASTSLPPLSLGAILTTQ